MGLIWSPLPGCPHAAPFARLASSRICPINLTAKGVAPHCHINSLERDGGAAFDARVRGVGPATLAALRPFLQIEDDGWDSVLATNLRGAFLMAQRVARVQAAGHP